MAFIDKLEHLCADSGLSLTRLAVEIGKGSATAVGWRKGAVPRAATLKDIADYFGVSVGWLLDDDAEDDDPDNEIDSSDFNQPVWRNLLEKCNFNEREALLKYQAFKKVELEDAMEDRATYFQNNGENYGVIGHAHSAVTIRNGKERELTEQEVELLRIYNTLDLKRQTSLLTLAFGLDEEIAYVRGTKRNPKINSEKSDSIIDTADDK